MRWVACVVATIWAASATAATRTYSIVIAENRSLDPGVRPLQFADDDGAQTWELLSLLGGRSSLFAVLDSDTARLHPDAVLQAEVPYRAAILNRLAEYNAHMEADIRRGDDPELLLFYAGHGDVDDRGEGYVNLHDARLTRGDLYRRIIAPSKARFVHIIIDACKSYFMVNARGQRPWAEDQVPAELDDSESRVRAFLDEEQLTHYPRAGVVVGASSTPETHEWAPYRGGVLSHELRSALAGAADINGDGHIEYSEVRAFLAAANSRVRNPEARVEVFANAPALDRHRPLADLHLPDSGRLLHFGPALAGRFYIEDDRGIRWVDLNKDGTTTVDIAVDVRRTYWVRRDNGEELEVRSGGLRRIDLGASIWRPQAAAARGALDTTFRDDLFRVAYSRAFYDGFIALSNDAPVQDSEPVYLGKSAQPQRHHSLSLAYLLSGAPAGQSGLSHGAAFYYSYHVGAILDFGIATEFGYGASGRGTLTQSLVRVALLGGIGLSYRPISRIGLRLDAAAGWQLLSGAILLDHLRVDGSEPRGFRSEFAGTVSVEVSRGLEIFARGGIALDGVYPRPTPSSFLINGFGSVGALFHL
jgi:hypothetical protein